MATDPESNTGGKGIARAASILLTPGSSLMADDTPHTLFEFAGADAARQWQAVNDGVMGGVSEGRFRMTEAKTLEFFGTLSLANNGGFASVRSKARTLGLEEGDTVVARVRGDGREYTLNLYLDKPLLAFSYRAGVRTEKDEWIEVSVPLEKFVATSFGRVVKGAGPVDPTEVNALGFMVSDKKTGAFRLEVGWIRVEREEGGEVNRATSQAATVNRMAPFGSSPKQLDRDPVPPAQPPAAS